MPPTTTTTLSGAIGPSDSIISTAANASILPGYNIAVTTPAKNETMKVLVSDPAIGLVVYRGARGTVGTAASAGDTVTYGPPALWGTGVGVGGPGVNMVPQEFEAEAAAEIAAEDAEKLAERVEKKRKELEKKAADEAAAQAKAAEKAAADAEKAEKAAEKNEKTAHPSSHK